MATKWSMKGTLLGACSCDWGCPCSFDAAPTQGFCEGGYVWHIESGNFGDVPLDGLTWSWVGHSPGAMHLGNVTGVVFIDEKATQAQRDALIKLGEGKCGGPWAIFAAISSERTGPYYLKFNVHLDGLNSTVSAGDTLAMELGPILNPVTNEPEELYLHKPTGFTSKHVTLGASRKFHIASDISYDHSGKYGEFSKFDYAGESAD